MAMVIKYGGNAMTDAGQRSQVTAAIRESAAAGQEPIVVHGGGPFIAAALDGAGLAHEFVRGLRVTSPESLPHIERVLTLLGKELAQGIGPAVGLTGRDAGLLVARVLGPEYGRVGRMESVEPAVLDALLDARITPVVACLALDSEGGLLNVNADEVAGAVAGAMGVPVFFLSDVPGVLDDPADPGSLLPLLTRDEAVARIADGRITGGMIPKVEAALKALESGAPQAVIGNGRTRDAFLASLRREGVTVIAAS